MTEVEDDEAANMKAFLKQLNLEPKHHSNTGLDSVVQDVGEALNRGLIDPQVSGGNEDEKQQYVSVEDGGGMATRPS